MTILKAENISKQYRLGNVGTGTLSHDLNRFWHKVRGKEDPYLKVGAINNRSSKTKTDYVWALRDINFEVQQGEVLGIIGKNGAGKSTLLKILSRVTSPTTGVIKTKGRIASLLEVGTGFHPELTGRENVFLNGAILGMSRAEVQSKMEEIIEFSGCDLYIDTPVKRYSSGMTVRLAFAVAAHLEPDILVIDEVLAVGDAEFQKKAIGKMQDISKGEGRTVLFVSHNMESIQQLCTRCIVMENGTTVYEGNVDKAISFYLNSNTINTEHPFPIERNGISIYDFAIIDPLKNRTRSLLLGKKCSFLISVQNISTQTLHLNIRLQIFNDKKVLVTTLNTYHVNKTESLEAKERLTLECQIEKLPISFGLYHIGIQIMELNAKVVLYENDAWDRFEIFNSDFFGSGKLPGNKNLGSILIDHKWVSNGKEVIND
jgi:lipopolysaccharide transport system ATP-binding protein